MADIRVGYYKRFNGTDWDTYYFKAPASVISETTDRKWLTLTQQSNINTYLSTFNSANKLLKLNASGQIPSAQLPFTIGDYLKRTGGTMLGDINMGHQNLNSVGKLEFTSNYFIATTPDQKLEINANGDIDLKPTSKIIDVNSSRITKVGAPSANTDAATKQYVDELISVGTRSVEAVKAATTTNISVSGLATVDGYQLVANDRVLVKNQTTASENGIYIAKTGAWTKVEADSVVGALVFVEHGTVNNDSTWMTKEANKWLKFSQVDLFTFGTGLTKTGNQVHLATREIKNEHIATNAGISVSKLAWIDGITEGTTWTDVGNASQDYSIEDRFKHLYTSIKLLRGSYDYNQTSSGFETQTIAGAYTLAEAKNGTFIGTATPSNIGYVEGDVYIHYEV